MTATTLVVLLTGCLVTWSRGGEPGQTEREDTAARLETALAVLETYEVTMLRNQDWCKNIGYAKGIFTDNHEDSTCNLFGPDVENEDIPAFTEEARAVFDEVTAALDETGVTVRIVDAYYEDGVLAGAAFHVDADQRDTWKYVYEPGYEPLPDDIPTQLRYTPINDDWYFVWDEWM